MVGMLAEIAQGGLPRIGHEDHVAALAAVAAVGTPPRNVRFAAERGCSIAAGAGFDKDADVVSEHRNSMIATARPRSGGGAGARPASGSV